MSPKSAKTLCCVFLPALKKKFYRFLNVMYYFILFGFWAYRSKPYKNCVHTARQPSSIRKTMMHRLQLHGTCIKSTYMT